jgi:hypothetical protein
VLAALAGLLASARDGRAESRVHYEIATVIERSELIVIGHLEEGSMEYVPHPGSPSGNHHATLVVTKVLKGKSDLKKIPLILYYGLSPHVGGRLFRDPARPKSGEIEIWDSGQKRFEPLLKDASQDNLWLLQKRSGLFGHDVGPRDKFGVADPEELQSLAQKEYIAAYLSDDPEVAVRKYAETHPDVRPMAQSYLDQVVIRRTLRLKDSQERFPRLLPFYLKGATWGRKSFARRGIVRCGKIGGAGLKKVFDDPQYAHLRPDIIDLWKEMNYPEAFIDLLKQHDKFWAEQKLEKGWQSRASEVNRQRRLLYHQDYLNVCALRSFQDPAAKEAITLTRDRWKAIDFDGKLIVQECETALRELDAKAGTAR